jgi:hypothetical protein
VTAAPPERAADFIASLGVNVHVSQGATSAKTVIADMAYLGLTHVRDHGLNGSSSKAVTNAFDGMAAAGLKLDWLESATPGATVYRIKAFLRAYPGSVIAVEGPNEVNNFPFTFRGLTGTAAAVAYQSVLYRLVHAATFPAAIPVLNFTDNPITAGLSDAANGHPYPKNGIQPSGPISSAYNALKAVTPSEPVYFTEAGYPTLPQPGGEGVDSLTQAKLTLNLIMDAANLGVVATYLYDLVDDGPDPTNSLVGDHFGLFTLAGAAKPAAVAIHNLTAILADGGASATTFTPTPLNDTFVGLPGNGGSRVIEKSSGVYDIVVWAEPSIWNSGAATPISASPISVKVKLGQLCQQVQVFDPMVSTSPISVATNTDNVTISLVDHPLIVQVSTLAAAMAAIPSSPGGPVNSAVAPPPQSLFTASPSGSGRPRLDGPAGHF